MFDEPTGGGPAPGEMVLFIARTGVGKTWWGLNVVAANPDTPAIFFSLEMHARYLLKRLSGIHTNTPTGRIEAALMTEGTSAVVDKTVADFPWLQFSDRPGQSIGDMLQATDDYESAMGLRPKLIVVDFLELVQAYGAATETEGVKKLAKGMKDLAREADAVVVVLHQIKRGEAKKERGQEKAYYDEGYRLLTPSDAMHGGEVSADYMVGAFRPAKDPAMPLHERQRRARDFRLQFLKTRGDEEIDPYNAVQHDWDARTGRISEIDWTMYEHV